MNRWLLPLACVLMAAAIGVACVGSSPGIVPRMVVWLQLPKVPPWLQRACTAYIVVDQMYTEQCVPVADLPECVDMAAHRYAFQSAAQGLLVYTRTEVK